MLVKAIQILLNHFISAFINVLIQFQHQSLTGYLLGFILQIFIT